MISAWLDWNSHRHWMHRLAAEFSNRHQLSVLARCRSNLKTPRWAGRTNRWGMQLRADHCQRQGLDQAGQPVAELAQAQVGQRVQGLVLGLVAEPRQPEAQEPVLQLVPEQVLVLAEQPEQVRVLRQEFG